MFKSLKTAMYANDIDQKTLSKAMGKSTGYLSSRITGKKSFSLSDVYAICDYLNLPYEKIPDFFPKEETTGGSHR